MDQWHDFFVAQVGASAALTGLIFVGVSVSLDEIIRYPHLVLRAASSLFLVMTVLVVSSALLAPLASVDVAGWIVVVIGAAALTGVSVLGTAGVRRAPERFRSRTRDSAKLGPVAVLPFLVAGVVLLVSGTEGLYWLIPGFMLCFIVALADAWVLLVETHR